MLGCWRVQRWGLGGHIGVCSEVQKSQAAPTFGFSQGRSGTNPRQSRPLVFALDTRLSGETIPFFALTCTFRQRQVKIFEEVNTRGGFHPPPCLQKDLVAERRRPRALQRFCCDGGDAGMNPEHLSSTSCCNANIALEASLRIRSLSSTDAFFHEGVMSPNYSQPWQLRPMGCCSTCQECAQICHQPFSASSRSSEHYHSTRDCCSWTLPMIQINVLLPGLCH